MQYQVEGLPQYHGAIKKGSSRSTTDGDTVAQRLARACLPTLCVHCCRSSWGFPYIEVLLFDDAISWEFIQGNLI